MHTLLACTCTHNWDMLEKERIKAKNQKGNEQQITEKCSMNAHSHILYERRATPSSTKLHRTDAVSYVSDAVC